jgi:hypothetical protein
MVKWFDARFNMKMHKSENLFLSKTTSQFATQFATVPCKISFPYELIRILFQSLFEPALKRASL